MFHDVCAWGARQAHALSLHVQEYDLPALCGRLVSPMLPHIRVWKTRLAVRWGRSHFMPDPKPLCIGGALVLATCVLRRVWAASVSAGRRLRLQLLLDATAWAMHARFALRVRARRPLRAAFWFVVGVYWGAMLRVLWGRRSRPPLVAFLDGVAASAPCVALGAMVYSSLLAPVRDPRRHAEAVLRSFDQLQRPYRRQVALAKAAVTAEARDAIASLEEAVRRSALTRDHALGGIDSHEQRHLARLEVAKDRALSALCDEDLRAPGPTDERLHGDSSDLAPPLPEENGPVRVRLDRLRDLPHEFLCPITQTVMEDPVMTDDGETYERAAIEAWFAAGHRTSPRSNVLLSSTQLRPNRALRRLIADNPVREA